MWCVATLDEDYIRRMEDVLALYEKPLSEEEPVVCIDEKPVVLHRDLRAPSPARPGQLARRDYEYKRCGTANVFCGVEPKAGRHFPKATPNRCAAEFADYNGGDRRPLSAGQDDSSGSGQLEYARTQVADRTLRRKVRWSIVGPLHSPLHAQARQLAQPGRDRNQHAQPPMPG